MQIEHMKEYITVANEHSVSIAAQKLHMTQPVLSKHMRALEDELHAQLLFRSTRGITLTPAGSAAYNAFLNIVHEYDKLTRLTKLDDTELCGKIVIGILTMGFDTYIAPLVREFHKMHPNVAFSYVTRQPEDLARLVEKGDVDFGFLGNISSQEYPQMDFIPISHEKMYFLVREDAEFAEGKATVTPQDMENAPLICLRTAAMNPINRSIFSAGFKPSHIAYVDELEVAPAEVQYRNGYFVIPKFQVNYFKSTPGLKIVEPSVPVYAQVSLITRKTARSPLLSLFSEWVTNHGEEVLAKDRNKDNSPSA